MQTFTINLLFGKVEGFPQDKPTGWFTARSSVSDVIVAHLLVCNKIGDRTISRFLSKNI